MEYDLYNRNEVADEQPIEEYQIPSTAKYYRPTVNRSAEILPLRNIILNDRVKIILNKLKNTLQHNSYSSKNFDSQKLLSLDLNLRNLFTQFVENKNIQPIQVREMIVINDPSPSDHSIPSVVGLGAPLISHYPSSTDFLYQIIDGVDRAAMSLYFNYDHIPVIVQV